MLQTPFQWLANLLAGSAFSEYIQVRFWIIPTLQVLHLLALAAVMVAAWLLCMRLMGLSQRTHSIDRMARQFLPYLWGGLIVLTISGSLLVIAEPFDTLLRPMMQLKLLLILVAIVLTTLFHFSIKRGVFRDEVFADGPGVATGKFIKLLALITLLIWLSIAAAGRLIAYV